MFCLVGEVILCAVVAVAFLLVAKVLIGLCYGMVVVMVFQLVAKVLLWLCCGFTVVQDICYSLLRCCLYYPMVSQLVAKVVQGGFHGVPGVC